MAGEATWLSVGGFVVPMLMVPMAGLHYGLAVSGLAVVILLTFWWSTSKAGAKKLQTNSSSSKSEGLASPTPANRCKSTEEFHVEDDRFSRCPNLQGTLIPFMGPVHSNAAQPFDFETDNASGKFLNLHRPTTDAALDKSGDYPYGDHFKGRKRLWEVRIQFRVKRALEGKLLCGLELENYVPMDATTKRLMGLVVAALRSVVGNDLYHSVGDDPSQGSAPHEKPVFMMPLWACDQIIVTPAGEDPPDLTSPYFSSLGSHRTDDRMAFIKEMSELQIVPGPVYTIGFWGISQFLDIIKWQVMKVVPFKPLDFNLFCGKPPVTIVFYTLSPSKDENDQRHLQSRKNDYFRYTFWSSDKKPSAQKLRELIPDFAVSKNTDHKAREGWIDKYFSSSARWLGCCPAPR